MTLVEAYVRESVDRLVIVIRYRSPEAMPGIVSEVSRPMRFDGATCRVVFVEKSDDLGVLPTSVAEARRRGYNVGYGVGANLGAASADVDWQHAFILISTLQALSTLCGVSGAVLVNQLALSPDISGGAHLELLSPGLRADVERGIVGCGCGCGYGTSSDLLQQICQYNPHANILLTRVFSGHSVPVLTLGVAVVSTTYDLQAEPIIWITIFMGWLVVSNCRSTTSEARAVSPANCARQYADA